MKSVLLIDGPMCPSIHCWASFQMLRYLFAILLLFAPLAHAVELTIVTTTGYVRFSVPDDWGVMAMQTKPPVSVAAFQVFNPADQGTPHSTNAAVTLYYPDTERGRTALSVIGRAYGNAPPSKSEVDGWTLYEQHPSQNGTAYTVLDAKKAVADVVVGIRLAWPELPNNPPDYNSTMRNSFEALRQSVSGGLGVPSSRQGEVIRRPVLPQ